MHFNINKKGRRAKRSWKKRIVSVLSAGVVFLTVYALILPAITLDQSAASRESGFFVDNENSADDSKAAEAITVADDSVNDDLASKGLVNNDSAGGDASEADGENGASGSDDIDNGSETDLADARDTADAGDAADVSDTVEPSNAMTGAADLLTAEGNGYTVSLSYTADAAIPDGAVLKVQEFRKGFSKYREYLSKAEESVKEADENTSEIQFARFYDITILDKEGNEIEPAAPVRVEITYDKAIEVATGAAFKAVHFTEDAAEVIEAEAEVIGDEAEAVEQKSEKSTHDVSAVSFDAESFSVYGIVYTVDFEYELDGKMYRFSLLGGDKITLSDLIEVLGIIEGTQYESVEAFLADVENVEFSDESLVKVTWIEGDWELENLQAFETEENLTITMKNGDVVTVKVTDPPGQTSSSSNLADYLQNAVINALTNEQGAYVIQPGDTYSITLSFKESQRQQFPNSGTMTYEMPKGLNAINGNGSTSIKVTLRNGRTITVPNNVYTVSNGVLTFNWSDEPEIQEVFASNNTGFSITFEGTIDEEATRIQFSDTISKDIQTDTNSNVTVTKIGNVSQWENKIHYTVNVQSSGTSSNVVVSDTLAGAGLTLDASSITATSSTGNTVSMSGSASGNSFNYTIPSMRNGEIITFTYDAVIDPSVLSIINGQASTTAENGVKVVSDGDPDGDTAGTSNTISYVPNISKSSAEILSQTADTTTLRWTLNVNSDRKISMAGSTVTDTIDSASQSIMKYSGDGLTVVVTDENGNTVRTDSVPWASLTNKSDSSWIYKIPDSDAGHAYQYDIQYTTQVDTSGLTALTTVKNTGTTEGGTSATGEGTVGSSGGSTTNEPEIQKSVSKVDLDEKEVTWTVVFTVPESGLEKAEVTDTYPSTWIETGEVREAVKKGSVQVDGLLSGETFSVQYNDTNVVISFAKDGISPGLNGGSTSRIITVTLKTEINDDWLESTKTSAWQATHTNYVALDCGSTVVKDSAFTEITGPNLTKTAAYYGTRIVDGVELPIYKYTVIITGVGDPSMTITDFFDTEILEPYIIPYQEWEGDKPFYMYGGTVFYMGNEGKSPASYLSTATGMEIVTSADSVPMDNGSFYPSYRLVYYLTVKDETALQKLISRAAKSENGKYTITNKAEWNGQTDTGDVIYEYEGLDKEILTSDEELSKTDEEIYADFRITLNPAAQILNDMEPLTMTDTFENLSIVYDSIKATPSEGVSWDFSGNTATFTIPDATKVIITYKARVVRSDSGTATIHFSNTAKMDAFRDTIEKDATFTTSGAGLAFQNAINLLKYEAGDMTKTLSGAQFALYNGKETGETDSIGNKIYDIDLDHPVVDKDGTPVVLTTGEDGKVEIYGDEEKDGWSIYASDENETHQYYLREIVAPEGYMLSSFDYSFRISADGTTDYEHYIYHSGDTMSAKNYPGTDVQVNKVWSDGNDQHDSDTVTVKLQQRLRTGTDSETGEALWSEWSDSIRMEDASNGYEWKDYSGKSLVLNKDNDWHGLFASLPLVVPSTLSEGEVSEDVDVQYKIVETLVNDKKPDEDTIKITQSNSGGAYVFTVTNAVEEKSGSLKIQKKGTVNSVDPTAANKAKIDGDYTFTVAGTDADTNGNSVQVKITLENGVATAVKKEGTSNPVDAGVSIEEGIVTVSGLPTGRYTVTENLTDAQKAAGITLSSSANTDVTVSADVSAAVPTATFVNNVDLTDLEVEKTWADSKIVNHESDQVTYVLYQIPMVGETRYDPVEVSKEAVSGYTGKLDNSNDFKETISLLPKRGQYIPTGETIPIDVMYKYYVSEDTFDGYTSSTHGEQFGDSFYKVGITNTPFNPSDQNTEVYIKKEWKDASGKDVTSNHTEDTITFRVTQKKYSAKVDTKKTGLDFAYAIRPVKITLIDGDGSTSGESKYVYVTSSGTITITAKGNVRVRGHGFKAADNTEKTSGRNKTFTTTQISTPREVTLTLTGNSNAKWGTDETISVSATLDNTRVFEESQLMDSLTYGSVVETKTYDYSMRLTSDGTGSSIIPLEGSIGTGTGTGVWAGKITDIPLMKNDNGLYVYKYEITEVKIGAEEVNTTNPPDGFIGQTAKYFVKWDQNSSTGVWEITNQEKPGISVTVKKVAKADVNNVSAATLPGATFKLVKYTASNFQQIDDAFTAITIADSSNDHSGVFSFAGLPEGYYKLEETVCPDGYVKTASDPRFRVKSNGNALVVVLVDDNGNDVESNMSELVKVKNDSSSHTVTVGNESGVALPSAGGRGTHIFYALGAILALGAGFLLLRRRMW